MLITNLSFKFCKNSETYFFKNLNIEFSANTVNFIQGDNGIGKSTFFNCLQASVNQNAFLEASLQLDGLIYTAHNNNLPDEFVKKVHLVEQNYNTMLASQLSVRQNLQLACIGQYPLLKVLPEATMFQAFQKLNIHIDQPVYLLSGGQKQLLAIFMALQKPTQILLLDEPTATLDRKNARLVVDTLYELAQQLKITILMICHDKELIDEYARGKSFVMEENDDGTRLIRSV